MKKLIPFLVSGILVVGAVGCQQGANNADSTGADSEAPANAVKDAANKTETAVKDAAGKVKDTTTDAANQTGDAVKGAADKTATAVKGATDGAKSAVQNASGVKTIVANKLAEKFPGSKLEVNEKDGVLTVTGTVPDQETLKKIEPAVKEYKFQGIKTVKVDAKVAENKPQ